MLTDILEQSQQGTSGYEAITSSSYTYIRANAGALSWIISKAHFFCFGATESRSRGELVRGVFLHSFIFPRNAVFFFFACGLRERFNVSLVSR